MIFQSNLNDAFTGAEKNINYTTYKKCKTCSGSGAKPGSKPSLVTIVMGKEK